MSSERSSTTKPTTLVEPDPGVADTEAAWMARGRCKDIPPGTFFPSDGVGVEVARRICAGCPVKAPCLEYALFHRIDHGVWGGASERERRRILRQRRADGIATPSLPR